MGLLDLNKRNEQNNKLTSQQVDENWSKIEALFPTPANGNTDVGKTVVLKADKTGFEYATLAAGGGGVKRFPKESSLTSAHIGLLAMQQVVALNNNPQGINDFDIKAVLANTIAATPGTKGVYRIAFSGLIMEMPVSKLIRVTFYHNPQVNDRLNFDSNTYGNMGTLVFKSAGNANASMNEVEIGNTLHQTISNVLSFFSSASTILTSECARVETSNNPVGDGESYIVFEMQYLKPDQRKYLDESQISYQGDPFQPGVGNPGGNTLLMTDNYGHTVAVVVDNNPNVDGHFPVTQIGDQAYSGGELFILSTGELAINYTGMYYNVLTLSREQNGTLNLNGGMVNRNVASIFPLWYEPYQIFNVNTDRALTMGAAINASSIANIGSQYYILANSWDSNGSGQTIIDYASLFRNDAGQPHGTFGAFGLKYFANNTEVIAALNWALNNTPGNWFTTMYDVVTPLAYNSGNSSYEIVVRNKTAPMTQASDYFQVLTISNVNANTEVVTNAQSGRAERIPYVIIGKVVGIDGSDALIDTSYIYDLKMCSEADGAFGILPYADDMNYGNYIPGVIAWRNGTVIDLAGYYTLMQNAGFQGDNLMQLPLLVGGYFRPVGAAAPDGQVAIDGKFTLFL